MSLIQEINRTETEKNKTKQVAINIDNKLVELGGEQATDLSDVPNKINELARNYKKFAKVTYNKKIQGSGSTHVYANFTIPVNVAFTPRWAIVTLRHVSNTNVIPNDERGYSVLLDMNNLSEKKWKAYNYGDYARCLEITFSKQGKDIYVSYDGQTYQGFNVTLVRVVYLGE